MTGIETPEWLKIVSVEDIAYKKDPVKVNSQNEHITFDSGILHADENKLQIDDTNSDKTRDDTDFVLHENFTSTLKDPAVADHIVITGETFSLKPVKIETFDHKNEAPDLESVSLKHSNSESKSVKADHLQNLVPNPIPQAHIVDPLDVSGDAGNVVVGDKCDEFSCLNQGKCVDDGTVYRNKLRCDCLLGSTGQKCEKGEYSLPL